ncbi:ribonuclease domain-containing protein [Sinosporangium siamense]|uniref:Ribonuclease N1 n=1 Tax=Sinosporangium siamense TaxID=1367973 RepID=A0A919VGU6_9ACTN|nr:ribonuclease domain-containing protein [Sinosporangium siamense]GII97459.1 ribonuclease N1 [Sinosporangium siamense]
MPAALRLRLAVVVAAAALAVPVGGAAPAAATVHPACTHRDCPAAYTANSGWGRLGYPTTRAWHAWPYGQANFSGGRYRNLNRQLPAGGVYYEYDVNPRRQGARRDAYRLVRDSGTGTVWFSPDHYNDFYKM